MIPAVTHPLFCLQKVLVGLAWTELHLQHAAAHLHHHQHPPITTAIEYPASVCLQYYFFLHLLCFLFFSTNVLAGTSYRPAIFHVTKPGVA